ncbi:MAG TPA: fluoride efflux transporter CrcB [Leucothrix sp.]|nr:fluoride efflux transporter CrcB [Leucothrix sp.]HIQ14167.1 fluoride efflux transporter CrcB [Leucothrix sp.]
MTISGAQILAIMFGGSLGALMRYLISTWVNNKIDANFPFGTLIVNTIGSFLMGFLAVWLVEKLGLNPLMRLAIFVGFLGAFTTFSTFSMETLNLFEEGFALRALLNMLINVTFTVLAVWLGVLLGKQL